MGKVVSQNLITLSHAVEFAAKVITKVAGNDIASTVNGQQQTDLDIKSAIAAKIQAKILGNKGAV